MRGLPLKNIKLDQRKTRHLPYTRSTIHIDKHLSTLSIPFELQTESQLSLFLIGKREI